VAAQAWRLISECRLHTGFALLDSEDGPVGEGSNLFGKRGLVFSSPQDCQKIEKGQTATIEFVAQTPRSFPFRCCTRCGWNHRAMQGQLIVEPLSE
jgi:hypothetical protein